MLEVPSVIIPSEKNYVINPQGWTYPLIRWSEPQEFRLDPRLIPVAR